MKIAGKEFDLLNRTYVMGILNVTPDSFSDGGNFHQTDKALFRAEKMIEDGVDIIDIGGESTRPGAAFVSAGEEISRVLPVVKAIKERFDIPVSVDTYKGETARALLEAGADMINDIWGLTYDTEIAKAAAEYHATVCLMHNRKVPEYMNFMEDVKSDLAKSLEIAESAGIRKEDIILDPGIGFAKNYEQNLYILNHLKEFHCFGVPLLLGASRKSVIGLALDLPVEEREEGTLATTALAVAAGYGLVRVHDVRKNKRMIAMMERIRQQKNL